MPDISAGGRRVVLFGEAETPLVEATHAAFSADGDRVEQLDEDALRTTGRIDVGICLARPRSGRLLVDLDPEGLERAIDETAWRPVREAIGVARAMAAGDGGTIVVVGSLDAAHAYAARAHASVAMGALLGLVRSIAVELSSRQVRANLVIAGPMSGPDGAAPSADEGLLTRTLSRSPVGRLGGPAEVAAAIRFAAGPDSGFMSGQTLRVDGGWASLNQAPEGMRFP